MLALCACKKPIKSLISLNDKSSRSPSGMAEVSVGAISSISSRVNVNFSPSSVNTTTFPEIDSVTKPMNCLPDFPDFLGLDRLFAVSGESGP